MLQTFPSQPEVGHRPLVRHRGLWTPLPFGLYLITTNAVAGLCPWKHLVKSPYAVTRNASRVKGVIVGLAGSGHRPRGASRRCPMGPASRDGVCQSMDTASHEGVCQSMDTESRQGVCKPMETASREELCRSIDTATREWTFQFQGAVCPPFRLPRTGQHGPGPTGARSLA